MRLLTAAVCTTVAAALLAACSGNGTSPSSIPGGSGATSMGRHHGLTPQMAIPKNLLPRAHKFHLVKVPAAWTKGISTATFGSTSVTSSYWVFPKNNSANGPPVCSNSVGTYGVNAVASDSVGDLIVPDAFNGIYVYAPPFTGSSCGTLLGQITDIYGQAADAAAINAQTGTIVVGHASGVIATCTLSSLSCTQLPGNLASFSQVAMDKAGNCYADGIDGTTGTTVLDVYAGCSGSPTVASGFSESYLGGIDVDNKGNLTAIALLNSSFGFPSTVSTYSGCSTGACTLVSGPTNLAGESIYGHVGRQNERWVTADLSTSQMEVYSYSQSSGVGSMLYSFNNGLSGCTTSLISFCEAAAYLPSGLK
jgi:hypothetical protein